MYDHFFFHFFFLYIYYNQIGSHKLDQGLIASPTVRRRHFNFHCFIIYHDKKELPVLMINVRSEKSPDKNQDSYLIQTIPNNPFVFVDSEG